MIESLILNELFQDLTDPFLITALVLVVVHFGTPLAYYWYAKTQWLPKPWNIRVDENYRPRVTVIIPTYNEAEFIQSRLDNIYDQDYPRNLMEVIVVDSASNDGTVKLVEEWYSEHRDINLKLIKEDERRGKLFAILKALKHVSQESDVIILTDADAFWEPHAISKAVRCLSDPTVGAVTASITYSEEGLENVYRSYYNIIRVAESKNYSTPIHNGPFLAIKIELIRRFGLPIFPGSDDSSFGSFIVFTGYRATQADDIQIKEPRRGSQFRRKIRRAQHLLLNFLKTKQYAKKLGVYRYSKPSEKIWKIEWWLHMINPWLLTTCAILLVTDAFYSSLTAIVLLGIGLMLLMSKLYRTWILQQLYLVIATVRNLWTREIAWSK